MRGRSSGRLLGGPLPAPASAVLQAAQAEPEAREAGPQPPGPAAVPERAPEREEAEEAQEPQGGADLGRADPVDVERLDLRHDVGAPTDLVPRRLLVTQVHALTLHARSGAVRVRLRDTLRSCERPDADRATATAGLGPRRLLPDQRARLVRRP